MLKWMYYIQIRTTKKGLVTAPKILRALDLDYDFAGVDVKRVRAFAMVAVQYFAHVFGNAVHRAAYCVIDVQQFGVAVVVDAGGSGVNVIDVKCHRFFFLPFLSWPFRLIYILPHTQTEVN